MKKIFATFVSLLILLPTAYACADGMLISMSDILGNADLYETDQTAIVAYSHGQENLYIKINYQGNSNDFVWIVPTPGIPRPEEAKDELFKEIYSVSQPRIEYQKGGWSDFSSLGSFGSEVEVFDEGAVGVYDYAILSATGGDGLLDWLNTKGYKISQDTRELIDWYIVKRWYFTAIKLDKQKLKKVSADGKSIKFYDSDPSSFMHPIKLSFYSDTIVYPMKISQQSTLTPDKYTKMVVDK